LLATCWTWAPMESRSGRTMPARSLWRFWKAVVSLVTDSGLMVPF